MDNTAKKCKAAIDKATNLEILMVKEEMAKHALISLPNLAKAFVLMSKDTTGDEKTLVHTICCQLAQNVDFTDYGSEPLQTGIW